MLKHHRIICVEFVLNLCW